MCPRLQIGIFGIKDVILTICFVFFSFCGPRFVAAADDLFRDAIKSCTPGFVDEDQLDHGDWRDCWRSLGEELLNPSSHAPYKEQEVEELLDLVMSDDPILAVVACHVIGGHIYERPGGNQIFLENQFRIASQFNQRFVFDSAFAARYYRIVVYVQSFSEIALRSEYLVPSFKRSALFLPIWISRYTKLLDEQDDSLEQKFVVEKVKSYIVLLNYMISADNSSKRVLQFSKKAIRDWNSWMFNDLTVKLSVGLICDPASRRWRFNFQKLLFRWVGFLQGSLCRLVLGDSARDVVLSISRKAEETQEHPLRGGASSETYSPHPKWKASWYIPPSYDWVTPRVLAR